MRYYKWLQIYLYHNLFPFYIFSGKKDITNNLYIVNVALAASAKYKGLNNRYEKLSGIRELNKVT